MRLLGHTNVLVIGDVMLDRYVYGEVERISPEAPVPILAIEREMAMPGGAGNVVRNLTALGAAVAFISVVGDDQAGSDLTGLIGGQPNVEPWLLVQGGRTTTVKTRYRPPASSCCAPTGSRPTPIQPELAERMLRIARDAMAATSVTVLSDYGKGVLAGEVPAQLIAAAREAGRPRHRRSRGAGFRALCRRRRRHAEPAPNWPRRPACRSDNEAAIVAAATALRERHGFGAVLVTRGKDGMTLVDADGAQHFPAEAAEVFDVSGAGDTAVATLAAGAGGRAGAAGRGAAGQHRGRRRGRQGRHRGGARGGPAARRCRRKCSALRKIVTREAAPSRCERWRHKGWRVGFTNGCFDLLHPGHVHLLEQAREAMRPAGGRAELRCQRAPAEGRDPAGAAGGGPRGGAGEPRQRRSGRHLR